MKYTEGQIERAFSGLFDDGQLRGESYVGDIMKETLLCKLRLIGAQDAARDDAAMKKGVRFYGELVGEKKWKENHET